MKQIVDIEVEFVSLVDKGANKKKFLITKSENGKEKIEINVNFLKEFNSDKQIVTGIVYEPNELDSHDEFMDEETIEKAAYNFLAKYRHIDNQHNFIKSHNEVVESWISKNDDSINGEKIKKGTWLISVKINDSNTWSNIKNGDITGFSLAGAGTVIEKNEDKKTKEDSKMKKELDDNKLEEQVEELKAAIKALKEDKGNEEETEKLKEKLAKLEAKQKEEEEEKEKAKKEDQEEKAALTKAIQNMDETIKKMQVGTPVVAPKFNLNNAIRKAILKKDNEVSRNIDISPSERDMIMKADTGEADVRAVIPRPIDDDMVKILGEFSPLFGMSSKVQFQGDTITLPVKIKQANSVHSADLGQGVAGSKITFNYLTIGKGVLQSEFLVLDELVRDTKIDLTAEINETIVEDFAEEIAERMLRGVLSTNTYQGNKFEGIETNTDFMTNRTTTQLVAGVYDWTELVKMPFELQIGFRNGAAYFVSRPAHIAMQTMRDSTGQPIWRGPLTAGAPATFNGYPIYEVWNMGLAAGQIDILFANMNRFYKVGYDFEMNMETDRKPSERATNIVTNSRLGGIIRDKNCGYAILQKAGA